MGAIGTGNLTLIQWAQRQDPNGKVAKIVELLNETNEILDDMIWVEGNLPTGHKTTVRSGLPSVAWRLLNYGVQPGKSKTVQVTDTCGMLEAYAEVDKDLADLNGNTAEFRLSEDRAFLEAMNQEFCDTLIYGDTGVTPEKFLGLQPRFTATTNENGGQIIKADSSASGDQTSAWLVCWGENTLHGTFPKGKISGLQHKDLGEQTLTDAAGGRYQGYRSHYKWDCGLVVRDWRYVVRIANIDISALSASAATGANLIDCFVQAVETLPNVRMGRPVFYCNKTVRTYLRNQIRNKTNVHLSLEEVAGKKVVTFDGIPVKRVDSILSTETVVS
ncbi:MAG TPA: hypothetical protein VLI39_07595 [Sedimentisphaerales bacterium]|nr:hypothetical protein [Sedimentisphaerales bacterium]